VGRCRLPGGRPVYLGHLFVEPRRHAAGRGDLTDAEARTVGWWCTRASRALRAAGAEHVYAAEEALAAIEEAVTIRRQLATAWPQVYSARLVASLKRLASQLEAVGRKSAADVARAEAARLE
jgi:hypothetical protein